MFLAAELEAWCFLLLSAAGIEAADRCFLTTPPPTSLLPGPAETGLLWAHADGHVSLAYACAGNLINAETSFRRGSCFRHVTLLQEVNRKAAYTGQTFIGPGVGKG